jgi:hypothetical protein
MVDYGRVVTDIAGRVDLVNAPNATAVTAIQSGLATASGQTGILNAVNALTRNTARSMPITGNWWVRPASGVLATSIDLHLYNLAGQPQDADDELATIAAGSVAGGTDYDALLASTTMTRVAAGLYRASFNLAGLDQATPQPLGEIYLSFAWAITETVDGATMTVAGNDAAVVQVQDAENLATLHAIEAQTDRLTFDGSNNIKSAPQTGVTLAASQADYAPAKAGDAMALTGAYDAAKSASSAELVAALGSPMQDDDSRLPAAGKVIAATSDLPPAPDNAGIADVKAAVGSPAEGHTVAGDAAAAAAAAGGTSAEEVWNYSERTLTQQAGAALGPAAVRSTADIYVTAFAGGTAPLCARVILMSGADATPSAVSAVKYSIFALRDVSGERIAVEGHTGVDLQPDDVLYEALQSDLLASGYNFKHVPDVSQHPAFPWAGIIYLVEYTLTPTAGPIVLVRFRVSAI